VCVCVREGSSTHGREFGCGDMLCVTVCICTRTFLRPKHLYTDYIYIYTYIYMYTYIIYVYTYICIYIHIYTYIYIDIYVYIYVYIHDICALAHVKCTYASMHTLARCVHTLCHVYMST